MSAAAVAILVEDEPQIRRFVRTALESENWRVLEAGTLKGGLSEQYLSAPRVRRACCRASICSGL
jgi:DNA-binding response OmpR family regulator